MDGFFNGAPELVEQLVGIGKEIQEANDKNEQAVIEVDGAKMFWNSHRRAWERITPPMPEDEPVPAPLDFFTLDSFFAYINENVEGLIPDGEKLIVMVEDEKSVALLGKPSKYQKERHVIASCGAHTPEITFGRYQDTERFNTMLLSTFIDTPARAELFKVMKSMTKEQSCNVGDDGVSQNITVKQGITLASNTQFQNPVPLKPMRTFAEVDQPESNFTLRIDEQANAALFEADGGAWKNAAVARIAEYLKNGLYGCNVVVMA